ncbi:photosynthetic reaction center subunit H, partial [Acidisphaera sp. L21]|uniref:photosynthetic reaction center subunit H n=1 Tax=Acidisphaera sp. L21 TaxID=1641851 RepID=UPI00131C0DB0
MQTGAITSYIDVAQLALYVFWLGFAGLIFYLRREDKREGYPLVSDRSRSITVQGFPAIPTPKTFLTQHGPIYAPRVEPPDVMNALPSGQWLGAPLDPVGDPMLAAMGPGSYAQRRADIPDYTFDDNLPKIVPLRSVPEFFLAWEDPNVIGMAVFGDDGVQAGTVSEAWIDRAEVVIRYLEVALLAPKGADRVLLPMNFAQIKAKQRRI